MFRPTDDLRIRDVRPLIPPAILLEEIPISERASNVVSDARAAIAAVIEGRDRRLVVVVGPCSIHDTKAALEYAARLKPIADRLADSLIVVMRTYFEKPRTVVGWKGLINDPDLDESFHINKGLRLARQLLLDVNDLGLPTGSEFLDTQIPQHIADLTSWVAIGARTAESQVHRELASGLSMPVGFKNSTDGSTQIAVDAVLTARSATLVSVGHQTGRVGDLPDRRQRRVPRHPARRHAHRPELRRRARREGRRTAGGQGAAGERDGGLLARQQPQGSREAGGLSPRRSASRSPPDRAAIFGAMLESHLVDGRQDYVPGQPAVYGQSITDACLSLEQTEPLLERLARLSRRAGRALIRPSTEPILARLKDTEPWPLRRRAS